MTHATCPIWTAHRSTPVPSAGRSFSATTTINSASELVAQIRKEYDDAVAIVRALLTTVDGGRPT
jgi:hypothetical protein